MSALLGSLNFYGGGEAVRSEKFVGLCGEAEREEGEREEINMSTRLIKEAQYTQSR